MDYCTVHTSRIGGRWRFMIGTGITCSQLGSRISRTRRRLENPSPKQSGQLQMVCGSYGMRERAIELAMTTKTRPKPEAKALPAHASFVTRWTKLRFCPSRGSCSFVPQMGETRIPYLKGQLTHHHPQGKRIPVG